MDKRSHRGFFGRRTVLRTLAAATAAGIAGCLGGEEPVGGAPTTSAEPTSGTPASTGDEPTPPGSRDETRILTATDIETFVAAYDDTPYGGGQETPSHIWKWVSDDVLTFLHFDAPDPREASALRWMGIGVRGRFCSEQRPEGERGGFTHFHKFASPTWEGGHGGRGGETGTWLLHVGVDEFDAPWGRVTPGVDYAFMPTPAGKCGSRMDGGSMSSGGSETTGAMDRGPKPAGEGSLTPEARDRLLAAFDDQPFGGGQPSPKHVAKWVNENAFVFLHFDTPDVTRATALEYVGIGVRGRFWTEDQPHPDFTHFHKARSPTWEGGHGGTGGEEGYWLLHVAVREMDAPWGHVTPGVDRNFMPTPPPSRDATDGGNGTDGEATTVRLVARDDAAAPYVFDPETLTVSAGTTVRWVNDSDAFHTVTSTASLDERRPDGRFDQSLPAQGDTYEYTFEKAGTYHYYCQPHAGFMTGTVIVE